MVSYNRQKEKYIATTTPPTTARITPGCSSDFVDNKLGFSSENSLDAILLFPSSNFNYGAKRKPTT